MALRQTPKHALKTPSSKIKFKMLALLPVAVFAVVCYCVSAFAWFQADIVNSGNTIHTTVYRLDTTINAQGVQIEPQPGLQGAYTLNSGTVYDIALTAQAGGAAKGYAKIQAQGDPLYTAQINQGSLSFQLIPDETGTYIFTAIWGIYEGTPTIFNGSVIGTIPSQNAVDSDGAANSIHYSTDQPLEYSAGQDSSTTSSLPSQPDNTSVGSNTSSNPQPPANNESALFSVSEPAPPSQSLDKIGNAEEGPVESGEDTTSEDPDTSIFQQENTEDMSTTISNTGEFTQVPSLASSDNKAAPDSTQADLSDIGTNQ